MKTAMQELIEYFNNRPEYDKTSEGYEIIQKAIELIEKEKEQIIKAMTYSTYREMKGINVSNEEYYNQTYKQ